MSGLIVITGPTGAGKTELAMALADRFRVRLISVDSAQVYRGMDIGTAKPDAHTLARYPHALIDVRDPEDSYSAADFVRDAKDHIESAWASGVWPVLVGGTPLYLKALLYGLDSLPAADPAIRQAIADDAGNIGWDGLYRRLMEIDPAASHRILPSDRQRIARALEIYAITQTPPSQLMSDNHVSRFASLRVVVTPADRAVLHQRIEKRFQRMLDEGLVAEVERLMIRPGLSGEHASMRSVGYRQVWAYLSSGSNDQSLLMAQGVAATRQLAKRQLTALRKLDKALWYDGSSPGLIDQVSGQVERFIDASARTQSLGVGLS